MGLAPDPRSGRDSPALEIQPKPMTDKISVTIPQACELTGLGRSTIYRLFDESKLSRVKVGSRTLIMVSDLRALMDSLSDTANEAA